MTCLNAYIIAEKPSAARAISEIMSNGNSTTRPGFNPYNKCHDYRCQIAHQNANVTMTSVLGHLLGLEFKPPNNKWNACPPSALFNASIETIIKDKTGENIKKTLIREARKANMLIIFTDNDREGEAIGGEIVQVVQEAKPNIQVKRAQYSDLQPQTIMHCVNNLRDMKENDIKAVAARSEIDLRIGSAFTRLMTIKLQNKYQGVDKLISFGSCQFPTMGLVVDRYNDRENFQPEEFWYIKLLYRPPQTGPDPNPQVEFSWSRGKLFDRMPAYIIYEMCVEAGKAVITDVRSTPTSKWAPVPLSTITLQKRMSRFYRMPSDVTMQAAEALYNRGIISYPRTETELFEKAFNLQGIIDKFRNSNEYGNYATSLLNDNKFRWPRPGGKNDNAHPPIHPTQYVALNSITNPNEKKIYEFVTKHFLACCSRDAQGFKTTVTAEMGGERFSANGLMVTEKNYLDIYHYEKWNDKAMPIMNQGEEFTPTSLTLESGMTTAPLWLTEAELITLMDRHKIGTDATVSSHIKTVQERDYVEAVNNGGQARFKPTLLGLALITSYKRLGHANCVSKPQMRELMERNLEAICQGQKTKEQVVTQTLQKYKTIYDAASSNMQTFQNCFGEYFQNMDNNLNGYQIKNNSFSRCGRCNRMMSLGERNANRNNNNSKLRKLYCSDCNQSYTVPNKGSLSANPKICPLCNFQVVSVTNPPKNPWHFCPNCYNEPPIEAMPGNAAGEQGMMTLPCFKCCNEACDLARGHLSKVVVMTCPCCKSSPMHLSKTSSSKYVIGCESCLNKIWLPSSVVACKVAPAAPMLCAACDSKGRKDVHRLLFTCKPRSVGLGLRTEFTCCPYPNCRENYEVLRDWIECDSYKFSSPVPAAGRGRGRGRGGGAGRGAAAAAPGAGNNNHGNFGGNSNALFQPPPNNNFNNNFNNHTNNTFNNNNNNLNNHHQNQHGNGGGANYGNNNNFNRPTSNQGYNNNNNNSNTYGGNNHHQAPPSVSSGYSCPVCSNPVQVRTVQKDNGNKGRQFYSCCGAFKWADEVGRSRGGNPPGPGNYNSSSNSSRSNGNYNYQSRGAPSKSNARSQSGFVFDGTNTYGGGGGKQQKRKASKGKRRICPDCGKYEFPPKGRRCYICKPK